MTQFRDALMTLREKETICKNQDLFVITTDETKLRELFDSLDFDRRGCINYSEFLAACLARKEGLRREYAELIFKLWERGVLTSVELTASTMGSSPSRTCICSSARKSP